MRSQRSLIGVSIAKQLAAELKHIKETHQPTHYPMTADYHKPDFGVTARLCTRGPWGKLYLSGGLVLSAWIARSTLVPAVEFTRHLPLAGRKDNWSSPYLTYTARRG